MYILIVFPIKTISTLVFLEPKPHQISSQKQDYKTSMLHNMIVRKMNNKQFTNTQLIK